MKHARSTITTDNLQEILDAESTPEHALLGGQQQYTTPDWFVEQCAARLPNKYPDTALDPQCGEGALVNLGRWGTSKFGIDIDNRVTIPGVKLITGNCVKVGEVIDDVAPGLHWECINCNPPFGKKWKLDEGEVDSTDWTWKFATSGATTASSSPTTTPLVKQGIDKHPWVYHYETIPGLKLWKGMRETLVIGVAFLLKKFEFAQPLERIVRELAAHDLHVSAGTLTGGLERIQKVIQPLAARFVLHSREGNHWQMDETRWPMFCLVEGKGRPAVVVLGGGHAEVTAFLLEPTRSGQVPRDFFPKGTSGILNVDRYPGYFALLGPDWKLLLAYCWAHQRRDFLNLDQGCKPCASWAEQWIALINELLRPTPSDVRLGLEERVNCSKNGMPKCAARCNNSKSAWIANWPVGNWPWSSRRFCRACAGIGRGLCVFVDHPHVPMDNNIERAGRPLAVARKNFYGSGAPVEWGAGLRLPHPPGHATAA